MNTVQNAELFFPADPAGAREKPGEAAFTGLPASPLLLRGGKLAALFSKGLQAGSLRFSELLDVFDELRLDKRQIEKVYDSLDALSIRIDQDLLTGSKDGDESPFDQESYAGALPLDDPVRMYLKEISAIPLLTAEEESALSAQISNGIQAERWLHDRKPGISAEEQANLKRIVEAGAAARQKLVESNLRLVVSVAKRYAGMGVPFLDLIQEGNLGLMFAAERFDYKLGFKFSTFATWRIRQYVSRAVADKGRTIRLPVHIVESIFKINRCVRELTQSLGRRPTPEEIAEKMDLPVEKVVSAMRASAPPVSLEAPLAGDEEETTLLDLVSLSGPGDPGEEADSLFLRLQIAEALTALTPREAAVLRLRFGLDDGQGRTLEEVGGIFRITRERVRQIESAALRKLRAPGQIEKLKGYL